MLKRKILAGVLSAATVLSACAFTVSANNCADRPWTFSTSQDTYQTAYLDKTDDSYMYIKTTSGSGVYAYPWGCYRNPETGAYSGYGQYGSGVYTGVNVEKFVTNYVYENGKNKASFKLNRTGGKYEARGVWSPDSVGGPNN